MYSIQGNKLLVPATKRLLHSTANLLYSVKQCEVFETADVCDKIKSPSVVVIGAGMAGLSAAEALIDNDITEVKILEASSIPGGRIKSCRFGSDIADLGAQWITGSSISNTALNLAARENLIGNPSVHLYDHKSGVFMGGNGRPINPAVSKHACITFEQILKQAAISKTSGSLMNYLSLRIEKELYGFPEHQRKDAAHTMYGLTNKLKNRWGAELSSVSANLFHIFRPLHGETCGVPQGFISILAPLLKKIPNENILYSKIVNNICWDDDQQARVKITTCDGRIFLADYVIVTVSLGILKAFSKTLFTPRLPKEKECAIECLGYGNITKLFIQYKNPFWVHNTGPIKLAWPAGDAVDDAWYKGIDSIHELPSSSDILMTTVSGKHANEVERMENDEIVHNITHFFRKFTNNPTIPYPSSILRSEWHSSKFFLGSNSYMGIHSAKGHLRDLASPVPSSECGCPVIPKIYFAGEATHKKFFSTVNGARLSGLKVARSIIELTKELGGPPPNCKTSN